MGKKARVHMFDKDSWICWAISKGLYGLFLVLSIVMVCVPLVAPYQIKFLIIALLGGNLFFLSGVIRRYVFRKLGRSPNCYVI